MLNEDKLEGVINESLEVITKILKAEVPTKDQLTQARIASSVVASGIRHEATTNARLGMQIRVANMVLKDVKERRKYLSIASPELKLLK